MWMIIDDKDEVWADHLSLERAERLLTKWSDGGEYWMTPQNDQHIKSEHYLPGDEW